MQVPVSAAGMGSSPEETTPEAGSKKRAASRQISKDDDPDVDDTEVVHSGTFQKASDAVLANRRIVKVRRTSTLGGGGVTGGVVNPFASVRLVAPVATAAPPPAATAVTEEAGAPDAEAVPAPAPIVEESEAVFATEKGDEIEVIAKDLDQSTADANVEVKEDVGATDVPPAEEKKLGLGVGVGEESKVSTKIGENGEVSCGSAVSAPIFSSETFQQLSSAKNAFSGAFGTGFSTSTFSFGSTQPSTGFSSFGSTSWTGSGFASGLFGSSSSTTGATAFPSLASVFGSNTNGSSTTSFQLFGSQGAAAATPTPAFGNQNTGGLGLQEVPSETGEEKEKPVFAADASLFEFIGGEWKERGRGEIHLNVPEDRERRPRLVMRSKGNLRLLLNANLFPDMKPTKMDNRGVTFVCANSAGDNKVGFTTYAVRMKDSAIAGEFLASIHIHKGQVNAEPRTPESSPKAVDRSEGGGGGSEQLVEEIVKRDTAEV